MTHDQSTFDAIAPGVGAEDIQPLAFPADDLEGLLDRRVIDVSIDVEEEQVGGVAVTAALGNGERLDPGHVDRELFERRDRNILLCDFIDDLLKTSLGNVLRDDPSMTDERAALEELRAACGEGADLNGITNAAFYAGNVGVAIEELRARAGEPDVVVVDPPRAGLAGRALRRLGETAAPRIVYVSCNPTTLAGDVKTLRDDFGYQLVRARPVDMFPHTPHVESVSLLERP